MGRRWAVPSVSPTPYHAWRLVRIRVQTGNFPLGSPANNELHVPCDIGQEGQKTRAMWLLIPISHGAFNIKYWTRREYYDINTPAGCQFGQMSVAMAERSIRGTLICWLAEVRSSRSSIIAENANQAARLSLPVISPGRTIRTLRFVRTVQTLARFFRPRVNGLHEINFL